MATLILYQSNFTFTQTVAEVLDGLLEDASVVRPFRTSSPPTLELYDMVVIGASIRMGQIQPELLKYMSENADALALKPHALFLACGFPENFEEYLEKNFPVALVESAVVSECVGGTLDNKMSFFNRKVANIMKKTILKEGGRLPEQRPEAIEHLSQVVNGYFRENLASA
jgi:menaquinone-dependent protoporphyrinogen oxidase